jgi:hypothetical protein
LVVVIASLAAIGYATLLPQPGTALGSHLCLACGDLGGAGAIQNILLFLPLGIGLAISGFSGKRAVILMFALSALIETAQLFIPGRDSTIGDVLTNSLGGALGFALAQYTVILLRPPTRIAMALTVGWSAVWLAIQTASAFGFSPAFPRSPYYGQIARCLGNFEQFRGRVLHTSIGDVAVDDMRFKDSPRVRELLTGGAAVTTVVLPSGAAPGIAPIVRVADSSQREIMLLAQRGPDLLFGVRTGAAVLRFRPPVFSLPDVFQAATSVDGGIRPDTLTVIAHLSAHEVSMDARARTRYYRRIPVSSALGWTMLLPFQWFIEGTRAELVVSAIWIASLLLPIGYWLGRAIRFPHARDATIIRLTALAIASMFLYVGLIVVPQAFGVNPASPIDWLAALAGILSGVVLAPRPAPVDPNVVGEAIAF